MKKCFAPAVKLLNHLNYPQKFGLIGLLFALPLSLATYFLFGEINRSINFSAKEQFGIEYLQHLQQFASDLRDRRGLVWARSTQPGSLNEVLQMDEKLQRTVDTIDLVDKNLGATLQTTARWSAIRNKLQQLTSGTVNAPPIDPQNQHTAIIRDLIALMSHAGDRSNLILDPDLDTFYLMDLVVNRLPQMTERVGQARGLNARLADPGVNVPLDQFRKENLAQLIEMDRESLAHNVSIVFRESSDKSIENTLTPLLQRSSADTEAFLELIRPHDTSVAQTPPALDRVWEQGTTTLAGLQQLYTRTSDALHRRIQNRIDTLSNRRFLILAVTISCSFLVVYLFTGFYLAVMQTIHQLDDAAHKLVSNQADATEIEVDTRDELGQVTRSFGALAARLQTECVSLKNSQHRLNAILEAAADAIIVIDEHGLIESANASSEELFGYQTSDLIGRNVSMLMPEPYRSQHDDYLRRYLYTGERHVIGGGREVVGLRQDGTLFQIDLSVSEVRLENRRLFTGFVRDISDRKRTEQELAAANAKFARVVDAATQVSIIATDVNGIITVFNSGAENLLGYKASELIGKETPGRFHVLDEIVARGQVLSKEFGYPVEGFEVFVAYAKQGRFDRREWTYVHKGGRPLTVSLVVTAVHDASDQIIGFLGIAEDITLRKEAERHLEAARVSAEQAARAKGEFLANMSHEIRTPMNGIIGMTDLMRGTPLTSEQREYLDVVKSSGNSLMRIINDILDFSKIEAGKLELDPQPFQLRDLLGDTMKTLAIKAHEKNLELLWKASPSVPNDLIGDAGRIRQILVNLAGNSIKFTEVGEVNVTVETVDQVSIRTRLKFSVSDTGIGVPEDKKKHIFEAFSQADASTTRAYGGTGLGLSISRQLVRMMGGELLMESEAGKGTTFFFEIELERSPVALGGSTSDSRPELAGLRVLVVDDNQTNRRILEEMLKNWGMLPTLADGGSAALDLMLQAVAKGVPFQLVLTDCHMPKMDGFMFVENLKTHPQIANATIMMLTSADPQGAQNRCHELGIKATLLKPLKQSELFQTICDVIRRDDRGIKLPTDEPRQSVSLHTRPLKVLLAEDNEVNQNVAVRMLKKLGHQVEVVGNGQLALEALQKAEFDVVLMDVQMPVLDGFGAVAAIRAQESATARHQHIIAMTAHAMTGDRQRCLDAGMDDYVSKPISAASLSNALSRASGTMNTSASTDATDKPSRPDHGTDTSTQTFDRVAALKRVDGDESFLDEQVDVFLKMLPDMMARLKQHAQNRDLKAVGELAHLIAGTVTSFCAAPAHSAAVRLEKICRDGRSDELIAAYENLVAEIERLSNRMTKR